tara:strand:+ start:872 stop:1954 length:1083 start_codon:yes stop_codon:yes gene_type:complete
MNDQVKIPCMFIRGGTSRGPYFLKSDLPSDINKRDKILLAAMGSPDLRQIDGLGGAEPVKSKVAIIDKSSEEGIDIDYYFAQVKIDKPIVDTKPSCGNILVGVGPYAIEKGLVEAKNGETSIIVRDKNTGMKIEQIVQTPNKQVQYDGNFKIDGVPTPGSPIKLKFLDIIGSQTNKLFPSGNKIDEIDNIKFTLIDCAVPMVIFKATDLGLKGSESFEELNENKTLIEKMNTIRIKIAKKVGLGDVANSVLPKTAIVIKPDKADIKSRYFMPWDCHPAYAVTGSMALLGACKSKNTICSEFYNNYSDNGEFEIEHPSGKLKLNFNIVYEKENIKDINVISTRNARLIMSGDVYIKKSLID